MASKTMLNESSKNRYSGNQKLLATVPATRKSRIDAMGQASNQEGLDSRSDPYTIGLMEAM